MAQVITTAGEQLFAIKAQNNQPLDIDTFIFAYVPGQDSSAAIDRNEGLPPVGQRVHQQIVQQRGRVNSNVVIYSTVLDSVTGPFEFNWVGLYSSVNNTLVAISKIPTVVKTVTVPGTAGNILNRNFGIEYSGIADLDGITVDPETWQLDYTARLNGMDELTRQLAADMNGRDWFIDNGFKVAPLPTPNNFKVTAGAGYVSGLRIAVEEEPTLIAASYPQFVYVNAWFDGTSEATWKGQTTFQITPAEQEDYTDETGKRHYLFKLATITAANTVIDHRRPSAAMPKKSIKQLQPVPYVEQRVECFAEDTGSGGGIFIFYPEMDAELHDGGKVIAEEARKVWDGSNLSQILNWTGTGKGCYCRLFTVGTAKKEYSPEDYGAIGKGNSDDTLSFNKALQYGDYVAAHGNQYNISQLTYTKSNTEVNCSTWTKIFSIPGNLVSMIKTVTGLQNIKWIGGIIDGNDLGQVAESDGDSEYAPAVGFSMRGVKGLEIGNLKVRNVRGHSINHWNCDGFHLHDIEINANPIRVQTEDGGVRRDGITGSSSNGLIENISGFTDDDMIALLAGADWGLVDQYPQDCVNVQVKNIRCQNAFNGRKTWRLLRVMPAGGYKMDNIQVSGLVGSTAGDPIVVQLDDRVNKERGFIGTISIDDVQVDDPGDDLLPSIVTRNIVTIEGVNIEKLSMKGHTWKLKTKSNRVNARCFFAQDSEIKFTEVDNLTVIDSRETDTELTIFRFLCGGELSLTNLKVIGRTEKESETYVVARAISGKSDDNAQKLIVKGTNWDSPYISANLLRVGNSLVPSTDQAVIKASNVSPQSDQRLIFTDPVCGVIKRTGTKFEQIKPPLVVWQSDGSHLPTSDWYSGFSVKVTGSPFNVIDSEIAMAGAAPYSFQPLVRDGLAVDFNESTVLSLPPTSFAPNCTTKMYITNGAAAGTPNGYYGLLETKRYPNSYSGLSNCYQFFYPSSGQPEIFLRSYIPNISDWSEFKIISLTALVP